MPDDLYWDDIYLWSEQQADRLRRLAAGERVNDVDWAHVIEEVEDVGKSELRACTSLLTRAMEHLLKIHSWPDSDAALHWRGETVAFLGDAVSAFSPAMRQQIDVQHLYARARSAVVAQSENHSSVAHLPAACPFVLDDLLADPPALDALLAALAQAAKG